MAMTTWGSALIFLVALSGFTLQADAALDQTKLKRPLSPYFAWLKESRKGIKGKNIAEVAKKAGEMWKSLPADKKKTYEERATKAKAEYAAYIAKVKGTDAFQAFMDKKKVARKKKLQRSVRSAMHKVPKDAKLKKPLSGYMMWFKGTRSTIKGKNIAEVSKKAGEMWKGLSAEKKKPFADKKKSQGGSKGESQGGEKSESKSQGGSKGQSRGGEKRKCQSRGSSKGKSQGGEKGKGQS